MALIPTSTNSTISKITSGGTLPFSPLSFLDTTTQWSKGKRRKKNNNYFRHLSGDSDDQTSYLVDSEGNEYEPYSLAWRYLGMYIDCDVDAQGEEEEESGDDERRRLGSGDDDDDDDEGDCDRKLLWAAYVDPRYRGNNIGEYKFFDFESNSYDKSSCKTHRCHPMDCHEPRSKFELIGVFKETQGLEDWAEQLFKHEGYCTWGSDVYDTMDDMRERLPTYCYYLYYYVDSDGNSLYLHLKPLPEGNITVGLYTDEVCTQEAVGITFYDYIISYYTSYYGDEEGGEEAALWWNSTLDSWNAYMNTYKVCQPCRAYSLNPDELQDDEDEEDDEESGDRRFLGEDNQDGEGEEEKWGYNCYDAAGYTNVNQCYKFEVKTDLSLADETDLTLASDTILEITVDGVTYGRGGFRSTFMAVDVKALVLLLSIFVVMGFLLYMKYAKIQRKQIMGSFDSLSTSVQSNFWDYFRWPSGCGSKEQTTRDGESSDSRSNRAPDGLYAQSLDSMADVWVCFHPDTDVEESISGSSSGNSTSTASRSANKSLSMSVSHAVENKVSEAEVRNNGTPNIAKDSSDSQSKHTSDGIYKVSEAEVKNNGTPNIAEDSNDSQSKHTPDGLYKVSEAAVNNNGTPNIAKESSDSQSKHTPDGLYTRSLDSMADACVCSHPDTDVEESVSASGTDYSTTSTTSRPVTRPSSMIVGDIAENVVSEVEFRNNGSTDIDQAATSGMEEGVEGCVCFHANTEMEESIAPGSRASSNSTGSGILNHSSSSLSVSIAVSKNKMLSEKMSGNSGRRVRNDFVEEGEASNSSNDEALGRLKRRIAKKRNFGSPDGILDLSKSLLEGTSDTISINMSPKIYSNSKDEGFEIDVERSSSSYTSLSVSVGQMKASSSDKDNVTEDKEKGDGNTDDPNDEALAHLKKRIATKRNIGNPGGFLDLSLSLLGYSSAASDIKHSDDEDVHADIEQEIEERRNKEEEFRSSDDEDAHADAEQKIEEKGNKQEETEKEQKLVQCRIQ